MSKPSNNHVSSSNNPTMGELFKTKLHFYFLNTNSVIQNINEETIKNCGYASVSDTINKTIKSAAKTETAKFSIAHDNNVLRMRKIVTAEESFIKKVDGESFHAVSIKYPWYDEENNLIGVFGCSFIPGIHGIARPLEQLMEKGLLNLQPNSIALNHKPLHTKGGNIYPSRQERECLKYLTKGYTIKMIAKQMNLSPRTVGHYLENIKAKLNVSSKHELIEKILKMDVLN